MKIYKYNIYNNNNNIYEFYVEDDYNFILTKLKVYMTSIRNNISTISSPNFIPTAWTGMPMKLFLRSMA